MAKTERPKGRLRRWLKRSAIAFGILVAGILVFRIILMIMVLHSISAIRAQGVPVTLDELAKQYGPAAGQGADDTLAKVLALYDATEDAAIDSMPAPFPGEPISPRDREIIAAGLAKHAEAIEAVYRALEKGDCLLPCDLRKGSRDRTTSLSQPRSMALLLRLKTELAAEHGDGNAAAKAILAQFALAKSFGDEAVDIRSIVRINIGKIALETLEFVSARHVLRDDQLRALDRALQDEEEHDSVLRVWQGERCKAIGHVFRTAAFGPHILSVSTEQSIKKKLCSIMGLHQIDCLKDLKASREVEMILHKPFPQRFNAMEAWHDHVIDTREREHETYLETILAWSCAREAEYLSRLRCARIALSAERYRVKEGHYPTDAAALVPDYLPELPRSPYTDKPPFYRAMEDVCRVTDLNRDGQDSGAHRAEDGFGPNSCNISFTITTAAKVPPPIVLPIARERVIALANDDIVNTNAGLSALTPNGKYFVFGLRGARKQVREFYTGRDVTQQFETGRDAKQKDPASEEDFAQLYFDDWSLGLVTQDSLTRSMAGSYEIADGDHQLTLKNALGPGSDKRFGISDTYLKPLPLWTASGSYFCFNDSTIKPRGPVIDLFRVWNKESNATVTFSQASFLAHGPLPNSVIAVDVPAAIAIDDLPWRNLRVIDLATRQEWVDYNHKDDPVLCACGGHAVLLHKDAKGADSLIFLEIGDIVAPSVP